MLRALISQKLQSLCAVPERLAPSAWLEHIHFGMYLVEVHQPRVLVELGVHNGTSYCAFCQMVKALRLPTNCWGIDTWSGDPHAGFYGAAVLADLQPWHDARYQDFSQLWQTTFDEACTQFQDGTIDLLHIDGLHTYEAVKHDFENWLPKLSKRGIVLFHDTNVRQYDFGVYRLWAELRDKYPSFEFLHGHGLGVLAVGSVDSPDLQALFQADAQGVEYLRSYFARLGRNYTIEFELGELRKAADWRQEGLRAPEQAIRQLQARVQELEASYEVAQRELVWAQHQRDETAAFAKSLSQQLATLTGSKAWRAVEWSWRLSRALFPHK